MRLMMVFYTHNIFSFTQNCVKAHIDWGKKRIACFVPETFLDPDCCTFRLIFQHDLHHFSKIEAWIRNNREIPYHHVVLEHIGGALEIIQGNPAYLNDVSLTEAKLKTIEGLNRYK